MTYEKELARKSIFMLLTNGIGKVLLLVANVLMARFLGAQIYGDFIYIFSLITIIIIISKLGIDQGLLRIIPQNELDNNEDANRSLSSFAILLTVLVSLIIIIVIYFNLDFISKYVLKELRLKNILLEQFGFIFLLTIIYILASFLQARRKIIEFSLAINLLQNGVFVIGIFVFFYLRISNNRIPVFAKYLALFIALLFLIQRCIKHNYFGSINWKYGILYKELVKYSLTLMLIGSLDIIIYRINAYMVGYFINTKSVGIYNSAAQIALIGNFLLNSINQVFAPMISKLYYNKENIRLNNIYSKINYVMLFISIIILIPIILFRKNFMLVFGHEFTIGSTALVIITIGHLYNAVSGPCGFILAMTGYAKYNMYINIAMLVLIIALNILLIPQYGINGAAVSITTSIILTNTYRMIMLYKKLKIKPFNIKRLN